MDERKMYITMTSYVQNLFRLLCYASNVFSIPISTTKQVGPGTQFDWAWSYLFIHSRK